MVILFKKLTNLINRLGGFLFSMGVKIMIYKYFKEYKKLTVLITLLGMLIGMLFFITKDTPPTLVLKKKKINIEYGQTYYANFKGLVDTTGIE